MNRHKKRKSSPTRLGKFEEHTRWAVRRRKRLKELAEVIAKEKE